MPRAQQNFPPPAHHTKNGESQTKSPYKPNKNISLPPLKAKAESFESRTNNSASQTAVLTGTPPTPIQGWVTCAESQKKGRLGRTPRGRT
jgi:hypothetical protein